MNSGVATKMARDTRLTEEMKNGRHVGLVIGDDAFYDRHGSSLCLECPRCNEVLRLHFSGSQLLSGQCEICREVYTPQSKPLPAPKPFAPYERPTPETSAEALSSVLWKCPQCRAFNLDGMECGLVRCEICQHETPREIAWSSLPGANPLPLVIRDTPPDPRATRLTGTSPAGVPSGVHSGGAWLLDQEIWKPLDGRPYGNCPAHYPTHEAEVLHLMANEFCFPRQWRIEVKADRLWAVRPLGLLIPEEVPYSDVDQASALKIEASIRKLNALGWELGDEIALAVAEDSGDLFIYDLSSVHPCKSADDTTVIWRFFQRAKMEWVTQLRGNAKKALLEAARSALAPDDLKHVYASFNRPVDSLWASLPPGIVLVQQNGADWNRAIPHTWLITNSPLTKEVERYELAWGWSTLEYAAR